MKGDVVYCKDSLCQQYEMIVSSEIIYSRLSDAADLGGEVAEHLNTEQVGPRLCSIRNVNEKYRLDLICDYYGIRYHLLLKYNEKVESGTENTHLNLLSEYFDGDVGYERGFEIIAEVMNLFWPFVASDSSTRDGKTNVKRTIKDLFMTKEIVKIQLVTNDDGELSQQIHSEPSLYPLLERIKNPCGSEVPIFQIEDIEILEDLHRSRIFKAKINDEIMCLKTTSAPKMRREIVALTRLPPHENLIPGLVGVVDAGEGHIDKYVLPFIDGRRISQIQAASADQKGAWERHISYALSALHKENITWGSRKDSNIMIENGGEDGIGKAVLLGLQDSYHPGCEDFNARTLEIQKENDKTHQAELRVQIYALKQL